MVRNSFVSKCFLVIGDINSEVRADGVACRHALASRILMATRESCDAFYLPTLSKLLYNSKYYLSISHLSLLRRPRICINKLI